MIAPNEPTGGAAPREPRQITSSANYFAVRSNGNGTVLVSGIIAHQHTIPLSRSEALNLAAWLSVIADPNGAEFQRLVKEIRSK